MDTIVRIQDLTFRYQKTGEAALRDLSLDVKRGECLLLCGKSGSGKTTVTKLINGLIPHFYENCALEGHVSVHGDDTGKTEMYRLAEWVGSVFQNPKSQFFYLDSDSELVFVMENAGVPRHAMGVRIERTVGELNIGRLLNRNVFQMSGGEKQILAFASSYIGDPEILVLDEPSANLDVPSIVKLRDLLKAAKDRGKTVIIAEHRLWFLKDMVDRVVYMMDGRKEADMNGREFFQLPRAVKDTYGLRNTDFEEPDTSEIPKKGFLSVENLTHTIRNNTVLENLSFAADRGEVLGIAGDNGCGKTTLSFLLSGLLRPDTGKISLGGQRLKPRELRKQVFLVMQDVNHQLFTESLIAECRLGNSASDEEIRNVLTELGLYELQDSHPMALSGGQKQRLAVASALLSHRPVLLFDEPTSGLDRQHMSAFAGTVGKQAEEGRVVIMVSHDNELLNLCAYRVLRLNGRDHERTDQKRGYRRTGSGWEPHSL